MADFYVDVQTRSERVGNCLLACLKYNLWRDVEKWVWLLIF